MDARGRREVSGERGATQEGKRGFHHGDAEGKEERGEDNAVRHVAVRHPVRLKMGVGGNAKEGRRQDAGGTK
jgi:hypothetical protein